MAAMNGGNVTNKISSIIRLYKFYEEFVLESVAYALWSLLPLLQMLLLLGAVAVAVAFAFAVAVAVRDIRLTSLFFLARIDAQVEDGPFMRRIHRFVC